MNIPENYQTVMPYLCIKNAESFLSFTKKVFGAIEKMKTLRGDKTVQHGEIMIGGSTIMFSGSTSEFPPVNAHFFIYVEDVDATYQKAVELSAETIENIAEQDYGRSCGIRDPFGNVWWITTPK